jgi:hypothetical protein
MQYFVVMPDGQKFGPADVNVLTQWAAEGRISSGTLLEDVSTGQRLPASQVVGIMWPGAPAVSEAPPRPQTPSPFAQPPAYSPYARDQFSPMSQEANNKLTYAWIAAVASFVCCPILPPILGMRFAKEAEALGNSGGKTARTVNLVILILQLIGVVAYFFIIFVAIATGAATSGPGR